MANPAPNRAPAPTAAPVVSRMKLSAVKSGKLDVPLRVLLYGVEGIGKSTFGANAPKPIFLGAESGTAQLDVARFPEARTWRDLFDGINELIHETHSYETLVIDTLDWVEPLCWAHICETGINDGKRGIIKAPRLVDFGFGKGYDAAVDEWRVLVRALERLIAAKRMNIVSLAHAIVKPFKNPEGDDYDRYVLKMHEKSAGFLKEWHDDVLFAKYETFSVGKDTRKAVSDGSRIIHTTRMAAWDAKNRNSLPEPLPLSFDEYIAAVHAHASATPDRLRAEIEALLPRMNGNADKAKAGLDRAGDDSTKLSLLLDWCRGKVNIEQAGTASKEDNQ